MKTKTSYWEEIAAGALAGVAGAAAMTGFQNAWHKLQKRETERPSKDQGKQDEPTTTKAAEAVSEKLFHCRIPESRKNIAGLIVHYLFGGFSGAVYRAVSRKLPLAETGRGVLFGAGLWAIADEVLVPAVGLSKPPKETPPSLHAYGLAAHLVYGLTTDSAFRLVRRSL